MNRRVLCLMVAMVLITTVCVFSYLASAAPQNKGNDRVLSKIKFIHYKTPHGKPAGTPGGKPDNKDEGYYTYMAKGAKWKTIEEFVLNCTNGEGVEETAIQTAVSAGMNEWETPGEASFPIFGALALDPTALYEDGPEPQGNNTISFRSFGNQSVIAQAIVWGYFGGPLSQREIIEAHVEFNDDFLWGVVTNPTNEVMDVQNIVTHELGHCAGMGDLYQSGAILETMYGYSDEGETNKRDLYTGDIKGITNLYQ